MTRQVSRVAIVAAIVRKDVREFSRDTLYLVLSAVGLVMFVGLFYLVPDTVEESLTVGIQQTGMDELVSAYQAGAETDEALDVVPVDTAEHLRAAVAGDLEVYRTASGETVLVGPGAAAQAPEGSTTVTVDIGIAFPVDFVALTTAGQQPTVTVYTDADVPSEVQDAMTSVVREIAYTLSGRPLPVTEATVVLGTDRTGDQASMRDRLRPMLAFFVLMIETFALSSLIANEILNRTVTAVLLTPARVGDFLAAKTIYGTLLTGGQALLLLAAIGALTATSWGPLLVTVLLGALMFTGIGMITGSAGKDFIGTLFLTMLLVLPLLVPTFSVLFPGTAAGWVMAMPSYPVIDALDQVTSDGAGWSEIGPGLLGALVWVVVIYVAGVLVLKRKAETL
ncbi:ABC transporter permease [Actinotalea sp.]|uniref:ABC transporter permease n=1 Tax=Actinotalea sp. TaxID=1872145 RepID=UPI00356B4DC4